LLGGNGVRRCDGWRHTGHGLAVHAVFFPGTVREACNRFRIGRFVASSAGENSNVAGVARGLGGDGIGRERRRVHARLGLTVHAVFFPGTVREASNRFRIGCFVASSAGENSNVAGVTRGLGGDRVWRQGWSATICSARRERQGKGKSKRDSSEHGLCRNGNG
jgi:hypothetical protein